MVLGLFKGGWLFGGGEEGVVDLPELMAVGKMVKGAALEGVVKGGSDGVSIEGMLGEEVTLQLVVEAVKGNAEKVVEGATENREQLEAVGDGGGERELVVEPLQPDGGVEGSYNFV